MLKDAYARGAIAFGDFTLDTATGELRSSKSIIRLQPQPLKVLLVLMENSGELVTRERLRHELGADAQYGDPDHAINVAITKLRSALHDSAETPQYIETFARHGYRFIVSVETSEAREPEDDPQLPLPGLNGAESGTANPLRTHESHVNDWPRVRARMPPRKIELRYRAMAYGAGLMLLVVGIAALVRQVRTRSTAEISTSEARLSLVLPLGHAIDDVGGIAISPDGRVLVYAARPGGGATRLFLRRMDDWKEQELPGTVDSRKPFFSPDGKWVAYSSHRGLYKVPTEGGPAQFICGPLKCGDGFNGGSWGENGRIVFASGWGTGAELLHVGANGGAPEKFTALRGVDGQFFFSPELLPGGRQALVVACSVGQCSIIAASSDKRVVVASGSQPHYSRTGHLLYVADEQLLAVPFDAERMMTVGPARALAESVSDQFDTATYAASQTGVIAVLRDSGFLHRLAWADRGGNTKLTPLSARAYTLPTISPDGNRFAVTIRQGASRNVWVGSPDLEPLTQLTFGNDDAYSLWSPDGKWIVFTSGRDGHYNLYASASDGSDGGKRLTNTPDSQRPTSWNPRGASLLLNQWAEPDGFDIYELPIGSTAPHPLLKTAFNEMEAVFSPDGRWIAYQSDESGRYEIYVRAYPAGGSKLRVSVAGGISAHWVRNGSELLYVSQEGLMAASLIESGPNLAVGKRDRLSPQVTSRNYDVSRDGSRLLFVKEDESGASQSRIDVIVGVDQELKKVGAAPP